uniref:Xrn1 helical domain-containing protein n=1 Tax=Arundo donax TaxID=35708 RepID=A0A0A9GQ22_ARUDO
MLMSFGWADFELLHASPTSTVVKEKRNTFHASFPCNKMFQGIAKLPFIDEKLLVSTTKTVENHLAVHEMIRNTVRQEKIFLRNSNTLANNAAFAQTSDCSSKKLQIDPSTSELGGWLSPADGDGISCGFFRSPVKNLEDIRNDQTLYVFS